MGRLQPSPDPTSQSTPHPTSCPSGDSDLCPSTRSPAPAPGPAAQARPTQLVRLHPLSPLNLWVLSLGRAPHLSCTSSSGSKFRRGGSWIEQHFCCCPGSHFLPASLPLYVGILHPDHVFYMPGRRGAGRGDEGCSTSWEWGGEQEPSGKETRGGLKQGGGPCRRS